MSLRQALTGRLAGDTSRSIPPSTIRRSSLESAAGPEAVTPQPPLPMWS
ncbi:MAG TPA: hypothetical protein VFU65_00600 [Actinocrinis sp.]|nr:hypothetical protein [Actinocrinis sp.]